MDFANKYHIKTFGCQANIADSGTMAGILEALGWERFIPIPAKNEDTQLAEILKSVDLLIINTCSVRQKSEDKVYGLGKMIKKTSVEIGRKPQIILSGCMVGSAVGERRRITLDDLKSKMPWVDGYVAPSEISNLPNLLPIKSDFHLAGIVPVVEDQEFAFVNISSGCDNFCTFCVVPYARGQEISRGKEEILGDVRNLINRKYTKIMLCGQNVNSWGLSIKEKMQLRAGESRETPFVGLLRDVQSMEGLKELAFISSNPFDFTKELVDVLKLPKISKYLHIAVQSGNNEVLKRMNRRHSIQAFTKLIYLIKNTVPDVELGTDIIVGFPGETREQFMDTVRLFQRIKFNVAFISMYSPREGTVASKMFQDDVVREEKKWRHAYLTKIWRESLKK